MRPAFPIAYFIQCFNDTRLDFYAHIKERLSFILKELRITVIDYLETLLSSLNLENILRFCSDLTLKFKRKGFEKPA